MIKYLKSPGRHLVKFNKETEEVNIVDNTVSAIDLAWVIYEDGELDGKEVKAGDIVFRMYPVKECFDCEYIIIKNKQLTDYYNRLLNFRSKENVGEQPSTCSC